MRSRLEVLERFGATNMTAREAWERREEWAGGMIYPGVFNGDFIEPEWVDTWLIATSDRRVSMVVHDDHEVTVFPANAEEIARRRLLDAAPRPEDVE